MDSPILNQVVLQDLIDFGSGSGKAALYQRLQSIDMHQGFNPKVQRVPKLEGGKSTPVGFIKVFVFEDLKSERKDALVAAHDFQGRVLEVGHITFRDGVPAWELTGHWDQQLGGADNDVPIASWSLLWQAGHQVGRNDFIIYYLQERS